MARICAITGRRPVKGSIINRKGQSKKSGGIGTHVTSITKRKFRPNLQRIRVKLPNGGTKRMLVSVKAIKAGGLFAVDIAPKKVAGAAMGLIGVFSYLGAAIQENISGVLIERGMQVAGDVRTYDFGPAIWFWTGSSVLSMLLAASLWRTRLRD